MIKSHRLALEICGKLINYLNHRVPFPYRHFSTLNFTCDFEFEKMPKAKPKPKEEQEQGKPLQERQHQQHEDDNDHDHDQDLTEESEQEARKVKEKKHDSGAADLEKVTDYAEETEITASDLSGVRELIATEMAGRLQKEKELLQIKIKKEDVELIVTEMEISYERAERALREHGGNLLDTLVTLTN